MEGSTRSGLVAVFAVSGSMVFLVHQLYKRLLSDFMNKFELQIKGIEGNSEKRQGKKKVRFAEKVKEAPMEEKKKMMMKMKMKMKMKEEVEVQKWIRRPKLEDMMPLNRAVLYRGIIQQRSFNANFRI